MVNSQDRNCEIKHSLSQQFYFSLPKCCQKNKTKQNRNEHKTLWLFAVPNSLAFIEACCRGKCSLAGISQYPFWGCGASDTLLLSFLGLWVPHNSKNAASTAEQRKTAASFHTSSPWSQEIHSSLRFLRVVMVPLAIQLSCQKPGKGCILDYPPLHPTSKQVPHHVYSTLLISV